MIGKQFFPSFTAFHMTAQGVNLQYNNQHDKQDAGATWRTWDVWMTIENVTRQELYQELMIPLTTFQALRVSGPSVG